MAIELENRLQNIDWNEVAKRAARTPPTPPPAPPPVVGEEPFSAKIHRDSPHRRHTLILLGVVALSIVGAWQDEVRYLRIASVAVLTFTAFCGLGLLNPRP